MNWDAAGAIGEIIGAIAVVATLFYLARQIHQNRIAVERSNEHAVADSLHNISRFYYDVFRELTSDHELAGIYHRALGGVELDPVESLRFGSFVGGFIAYLEYISDVENLNLGYINQNSDSVYDVHAPLLKKLLETPAGSHWWNTDGRLLFLEQTVLSVNSAIRTSRDV